MYTVSLQILNGYMDLIMDKYKDTYIFSTFFYTKLSTSGYQGVSNWKRTNQLFEKRLLMFPIHLHRHWCLVAVDVSQRIISLYDSLTIGNTKPMDIIENFLVLEASGKDITLGSWTKVCEDSPQQTNFNDCGVYVCMNARNLSEQTTFKFYLDISSTRNQIKLELLYSKLLRIQ